MTNDLERVIKLAEECDFQKQAWHGEDGFYYSCTVEQLISFEQSVLAKQSAVIEQLKKFQLTSPSMESIKAKLAMLSECIKSVDEQLECGFVRCEHCGEQEDAKDFDCRSELNIAIIATQADVDKFMSEKRAGCLAEVYSLIEDFGGDFTLQRLKDVMNDRGVR